MLQLSTITFEHTHNLTSSIVCEAGTCGVLITFYSWATKHVGQYDLGLAPRCIISAYLSRHLGADVIKDIVPSRGEGIIGTLPSAILKI